MTDSGMLECKAATEMAQYNKGDHVKVEFKDEATGESEWMWLLVERCDEAERMVFGTLDSVPVVHTEKLRLGQKLAVSFDNIRDHRKPNEFVRN